jgi:hypothetical protein
LFDTILGKPGNCQQFTPVERAVLYAVKKLLEEPFASLYQEQINLVNLVQRHADGKECNFYMMRFFRTTPIPAELALPQLAVEYILGEVTLQHRETKKKVRARVYVVNGRVFCVTFNKAPGFLNGNFQVQETKLVNRLDAEEVVAPLPADTVLPADYLQLLKEGQLEIYGWNFLEEKELCEIVREEDNLYLIATHEEYGMLCVRCGDASGIPIYLDSEDSDGVAIDYSLITFLKKSPEEREK